MADGTDLENTAHVSSTGTTEADTTNNDSNTTHTTVVTRADLTVAKSAPLSVNAGDQFTYTLVVTNNGPSTHFGGITVTDTLPTGATFTAIGSSSDCSAVGQFVTCNRSITLTSGQTATFLVRVQVDQGVADGTDLANTAHVSSTGTAEGDTANNDSNTTHTNVVARADLTIAKSAPASVNAGDQFSYTLTVTNGGPSTHFGGITVTDTLPTGATFVVIGSSSDCSAVGQLVTCSRSITLTSGQTTTFLVRVLVDQAVTDGTDLANTAHVSSTGTAEGNTANNDSNTTHTNVVARADLTVTKSAPATANAGDPSGFNYVLTVHNGGPSTHFGGITVTDTLPTGTTFRVIGSSGDCSAAGQLVTCTRSATVAEWRDRDLHRPRDGGRRGPGSHRPGQHGPRQLDRHGRRRHDQQRLEHDPHDGQRSSRPDDREERAGDRDRGSRGRLRLHPDSDQQRSFDPCRRHRRDRHPSDRYDLPGERELLRGRPERHVQPRRSPWPPAGRPSSRSTSKSALRWPTAPISPTAPTSARPARSRATRRTTTRTRPTRP